MLRTLVALALLAGTAQIAYSEDQLKIGFTGVTSGSLASMGDELLDGFKLKLDETGGSLGGVKVQLFVNDDQAKPDVGVQGVSRMIDRDGVELIMVGSLSSVMLAIAPRVFQSKRVLLSILPGASRLAGKECSPWYYNVSFENDGFPETAGKYLMDKGVKRAFFLAPNYQGGKDTLVGFKRTFTGKLAGTIFTPLNQLDFSNEISQIKAAKPQAVYFFYPGGLGIAFLKQWHQAGISDIELVTHNAVDQTMLAAIGDSAVGLKVATQWSEDFDNPQNKRFVDEFKKKYGRTPSVYAAQGYDGAQLIDAAVKSLGDKWQDADALRRALGSTRFHSVRGDFRFNANHYPIQDYYMTEVTKDAKGGYHFKTIAKVFDDHADSWASECKMTE